MEKTTSIDVGKILKPHGLRGEVRVMFYDVSRLPYYAAREFFYIKKNGQKVEIIVESTRLHKNYLLIFFQGVDSIDAAEGMRGIDLFIERDELDDLGDGEYYYWDLVGVSVFNADGDCIGSVKEIYDSGASAILKVAPKGEGKELHIPFVDDAVTMVDASNDRIEVANEFLED